MNKPKDREAIRKITTNLLELKKVEKVPPKIEPSEGWSPYDAQNFLVEHEVTVRDYHELYGDWCANGNPLMIGNKKILSNNICYYIEGDIRAAKQLMLKLNVNHIDDSKEAEAFFRAIARTLYEKATNENASEKYLELIKTGEGEIIIHTYLRVFASGRAWKTDNRKCYDKKITFEHRSA